MTPLRILLVVEEGAGLQTLRMVRDSQHLIVGLVTSTEATGVPIRAAAADLDCPVLHPREVKTSAFLEAVSALEIDLLLNVHSLTILPQPVLAVPRIGAFNLHPGPLPSYPGLSVPSWAIYRGEIRHAVTLHWMESEVDAGAIVAESAMDIGPSETGLSLSLKCIRQGLPLVADLLDQAARGPQYLLRQPQQGVTGPFCTRRAPGGGCIRWDESAAAVAQLVRAADYRPFPSPWGIPWTEGPAGRFGVLQAMTTDMSATQPPGTVGEIENGAAMVATGTDWLRVERISTDEGPCSAADLLVSGHQLGRTGRHQPVPEKRP